MIDLVEQANPADLESAGEALKKARNAIAAAAKELGEHIDRVDWEGAAGEAFRKWGKNLVKDTHQLSDFADTASVHIASAGAGLASVRSSMPPRDQRADPKMVEDIPTPKRVDGNAEYDAATKAETHRQEAINQMNRLSSFYQVSHHSMAGQEPPTFSAMPNVGVPKPRQGAALPGEGREGASSATAAGEAEAVPHYSADSAATGHVRPDAPLPSPNGQPSPVALPSQPVGMEIDSVGTLPPQNVSPVPSSPPPALPPTALEGGAVPPFGGGHVNPTIGRSVARVGGSGEGARSPLPTQGRTGIGGSEGSNRGTGRASSDLTRRTGPVAQGRGVSGSTPPGQSQVGRGITGGTPRSGVTGPRPGIPGTSGAARTTGVVGGRPAPGPVSGSAGSRVPRGSVIGGEGAGSARATGGSVGQRGVVGAAPSSAGGRSQMPRGSVRNPDGVVGTPKERTSAAGGRKGGFTAGGTGLVRGPVGNRRRPDQEENEGTQSPDYLVEEEETHLPGNRRHVPPVID